MLLAPCPCCQGEAEATDMMVGEARMWQINCTVCGLSTELDEDKAYGVERWNRRLEKERLKMWVTGLASVLPFIAIIAFLLGSYFGFNLSPG